MKTKNVFMCNKNYSLWLWKLILLMYDQQKRIQENKNKVVCLIAQNLKKAFEKSRQYILITYSSPQLRQLIILAG